MLAHNRIRSFYRWPFCIAVLVFIVNACTPTISPYSPTAYGQATSLKVLSLEVMENATEEFAIHEAEVDELMLELRKAAEYAYHRPNNEAAAGQWRTLVDSDLYFTSFLSMWRNDAVLNPAYIEGMKREVSLAFDEIIRLEVARQQKDDIQ